MTSTPAYYKFSAPPGGFNYNKLINELAVMLGQVPLAVQSTVDGSVCIEDPSPSGAYQTRIAQVVEGHRPDDIFQTGAFRFGANAGSIGSDGLRAYTDTQDTFNVDTASGSVTGNSGRVAMDANGLAVTGELFAIRQLSAFGNSALGNVVVITDSALGIQGYSILTTQTPAAAPELMTNGGFETGNFTGWTVSGTASVQASAVYADDYAAVITLDGTGSLTSARTTVTATFPYVFAFSLLKSSSPRNVQVTINWYTGGGALVSSKSYSMTGILVPQTSWISYLLPLYAPATAATFEAVFESGSGAASCDLYIDACSLRLFGAYGNGLIIAADGSIYPGTFDTSVGGWTGSRLHYGDYAGFYSYNTSASETAIYTRTIKANSLGTKGTLAVIGAVQAWNNSFGSAQNVTVRMRINGVTGDLIFTSGAISVPNGGNLSGIFILEMDMGSSSSSHEWRVWFNYTTTYGSTGSTSNTTQSSVIDLSTDFTSDCDFVITTQWASSSNKLNSFARGLQMLGPYYA